MFLFALTHLRLRVFYEDKAFSAWRLTASISAVLRAFFCLLVPRRPDVYHNGRLVDQEHSSSLWNRLTLGYATPFLRFSGKNQGTMATEHFPELPYQARAERLHDIIESTRSQGLSLFQAICKAHKGALTLQALLALGTAITTFGPHIALYGILKTLEDRSLGSPGVWAAVMGVSMCVLSTFTSWVWWITYSKLAVPISSELQALLYQKTMHRKDIKQPKEAGKDGKHQSESVQQQGQQEVINLMTVDVKRISDYASYNHLIPSSVTQFIIACISLLFLIGWQSLLAGLVAVFIMSPINVWIAQEYRSFQVIMMQAKDHRTSLVHEVVQNIRQIKFSATSSAWEERVLASRKRELRFLLQACFRETGFVAVWTLTPLLLSAVSLTVYALIYGSLSASVAFTSISIFGSLEVALAALPHLIATALEAKMSVDRIDEYLQTPDKSESQVSSTSNIIFEDATVSWPTNQGYEHLAFSLSNLSLKFPSKGLSIVSGRTGTGKTLLLSSILGESDIPLGSVKVPSSGGEQWRVPPTGAHDWIVDDAIAYVAQEPWIENGSIRENILFGLPLDRSRYQDVLFSTGLRRDLEILSDGDQTDIGANGVNLSGGQRARISFARALYSRAGIIIMDDIFSALDADTSRHVYDYGLTGHLARERTRVLATHHIGLCLPKADYCVVLEKGTARYVGPARELHKRNDFNGLLQEETDDNDTSSSQTLTSTDQQVYEKEGQRFSPEEYRAKGSVSIQVYKRLLSSKNSRLLWVLGFTVAILYASSVIGRVSVVSIHGSIFVPSRLT